MSSEMKKPCVVLGVTGGIAVYKACELLRLLQKRGIDVFVVMTQNACRFVAPLTFETLSGHPVAVDTFDHQTWELNISRWLSVPVVYDRARNGRHHRQDGVWHCG